MSSLSPQRNRKPQGYQGAMQNVPPRERSPSPPYRDRPRNMKTQSMPMVPSVMQMYSNSNQSRQGLQPSPTVSNGSHQSRRSSPPPSNVQIPSATVKMPSLNSQRSPESLTPPPAVHSHSQTNIHQAMAPSQHFHSLSSSLPHNPSMGYPRPINRVPPPQFLSAFRGMDDTWSMTEELMAQIEFADKQQAAAGTGGVAYAGGAASSGITYSRPEAEPSAKDLGAERVRVDEKLSPKEIEGGANAARRQNRTDREQPLAGESPNHRDRQPQPQLVSPATYSQSHSQAHTPERRNSPTPSYHSPLVSLGEQAHTGYPSYKRDSYQRTPTPPNARRSSNASNPDPSGTATATKRVTPPATIKLSSQTPPVQAIKTRSPDRSLPVQEEAEEDVAVSTKNGAREKWQGGQDLHLDEVNERVSSPTPSSDLHPEGHISRFESRVGGESRAGHHDDDDDETLIDQVSDDRRVHDGSRESEEEGHTPRSPSAALPDDGRNRYYPSSNGRQPVRVRNRTGATDQLGLRGFETAVYEQNSNYPKTAIPASIHGRTHDAEQLRRHAQVAHDRGDPNHATALQPMDDFQNFVDDTTSAYLHAYYGSPRPNAPIPPTPHSQTAAPTPSPLVSGMQSMPPYSPVPPAGSPYPFPFSHVRRTHGYTNPMARVPSSSNYDPNHPSAIQEQLALQWQMYALNNNLAPPSESTLSPSSTPFQGAGYNPWAFLHANRAFGGRLPDPVSIQSSPSHEPIPLPMPRTTGRGIKKRQKTQNLRSQVSADKLPPRVESTQPRETSPEPSSSGEETAGEERGEAGENGIWVNGIIHDDSGDWVDEDVEWENDDLLELEYHPSFVSNIEKRRQRWDKRWESLMEAFQAVDRQTDATLVLFASPSHSSKLHMLTSRSIRREMNLAKSPAMSTMRSEFRRVAAKRRASRMQKPSLMDKLLIPSGGSADGSENSTESREEDLRRALEAALHSLGAVGGIWEQREARWREEMRRVGEDRERVELLLQQTLGVGLTNGSMIGRAL